jgi:hypothetical protein
MYKMFKSLKSSTPPFDVTIEDWNATVRTEFSPFFQTPKTIEKNRELLRTELMNLARISPFKEYVNLLSWTIQLYRTQINNDKHNCINHLAQNISQTIKSDSVWISLFQTHASSGSFDSFHDSVYQILHDIDTILEGCYKPHFQILYAFAIKSISGSFPSDKKRLDFGEMRVKFPKNLQPQARLYLENLETNLFVNQWRNIAAHKTFRILSETEVEFQYGMDIPPKVQVVSLETLNKVLCWITQIHTTIRLASVIIYLEYMHDIRPLIGLQPELRIESWLISLCHSFSIVGFECQTINESNRTFILTIADKSDRAPEEALAHSSQVLDQLSFALELDPVKKGKYEFCTISLVDPTGYNLASATVKITDVLDRAAGKLSMEEYANKVIFDVSGLAGT